MVVLQVVSHSEQQTADLGARLATSFSPGDVIVLTGPLGSGKTVFVRGLARGRGIDEQLVNSPTFVFVNEYPSEQPVFHFDLYRVSEPKELKEIGWDDYLARDGLVVVEWGERAAEFLPSRYYRVRFELLSESERSISIDLVQ